MSFPRILSLIALAIFCATSSATAEEAKTDAPSAVTLENVVDPGANKKTESVAKEFSAARAAHFMDSASLNWQKQRNCMTCHTNYLYLMARPYLGTDSPALATVRDYAQQLVAKRWKDKGPRWDAEVVMTGTVLAINDAQAGGKLHPLTRTALDRMWSLQRDDGGFDWLKCDWPPMESDDHFGATMVAIGAGAAPDDYAATPAAGAGLEKLREYFKNNPPPTLHHKAMLVWASTYVDDLLPPAERASIVEELLSLQKDDGGWGLATLGDWQRADETPQDLQASDGYGTGFVIYIARRSGVPATDPRLRRGIAWLKTHQRQSGRWFTRSLHADNKHFITHAGTAFAVMALGECDAL